MNLTTQQQAAIAGAITTIVLVLVEVFTGALIPGSV